MQASLSTLNRTTDAPFLLELADGRMIEIGANSSGSPIVYCDEVPSELAAFSESRPPMNGRCDRSETITAKLLAT